MKNSVLLALLLLVTTGCLSRRQIEDNSSFVFGTKKTNTESRQLPVAVGLQKLNTNTWRTSMSADDTFKIVSRIIANDYILTGVDTHNLTLHTDWDKFVVDGRLFRNRLAVDVFSVGVRQTEIVIKNNVDFFDDKSWLPTTDVTTEVARLIKSFDAQEVLASNTIE